MNNNKKVEDLDLNTSPQLTDLSYIVNLGPGPSWADKKATLGTMNDFSYLSRTNIKGGSYTIQISECDKRWISNGYATGTTFFILPSIAEGMEIGIFIENNYAVTVYPQSGNIILPFSTTPGYGLKCSTQGACVYLRTSSSCWNVVSIVGTWSVVAP